MGVQTMIVGQHYRIHREQWTGNLIVWEHDTKKGTWRSIYYGKDLEEAMQKTLPEQLELTLEWEE